MLKAIKTENSDEQGSYNITEERISNEAKPVEYVVSLPLFTNGMDTKFPPGQEVGGLVDFHYLDSKFSLKIYPNGWSPEEEGFVSILLMNENKYDVFVNCEINMGRNNSFNFKVKNERIPARDAIGGMRIFDHDFYRHYYQDRDPEIICRITKVWKQIRTDDTEKSEYKLLKEAKKGIDDLWSDHYRVIRKLTRLDEGVDDRLASIEATQSEIRENLRRSHVDNVGAILMGPLKDLIFLMKQESQKNREDILSKITEIDTKFEKRMDKLEDKFNTLENCIRLNNHGQGAKFLAEKIQSSNVIDVESDNNTTDEESLTSDNDNKY